MRRQSEKYFIAIDAAVVSAIQHTSGIVLYQHPVASVPEDTHSEETVDLKAQMLKRYEGLSPANPGDNAQGYRVFSAPPRVRMFSILMPILFGVFGTVGMWNQPGTLPLLTRLFVSITLGTGIVRVLRVTKFADVAMFGLSTYIPNELANSRLATASSVEELVALREGLQPKNELGMALAEIQRLAVFSGIMCMKDSNNIAPSLFMLITALIVICLPQLLDDSLGVGLGYILFGHDADWGFTWSHLAYLVNYFLIVLVTSTSFRGQ